MLVLSRKPGERIHIGGNIVVTVVKLAGGKVRLGIEAPKETPIVREEIMPTVDAPHVSLEDAAFDIRP